MKPEYISFNLSLEEAQIIADGLKNQIGFMQHYNNIVDAAVGENGGRHTRPYINGAEEKMMPPPTDDRKPQPSVLIYCCRPNK